MKKLFVARHGASEGSGLSADGRSKIDALAERLKLQIAGASVIVLSSPIPRAHQSADIIARALGVDAQAYRVLDFDHSDERLFSGVLELVRSHRDRADAVILVTHLEFAAEFLTYFGELELGVSIPDADVRQGQARVVDCEAKTVCFV